MSNSSKTHVGKWGGVLLYNPSKTMWENEGQRYWYAVKNFYNLVGQIRRNTISIRYVSSISLEKIHGKNQEIDINISLWRHCLIKKKFMRNHLVKLIKEKSAIWCILTGYVQRSSPPEPYIIGAIVFLPLVESSIVILPLCFENETEVYPNSIMWC
jgi:hypothetical protein